MIEFPAELTVDNKLHILFAYHKFNDTVEIDEQDKEMIVTALNNESVVSVTKDNEGILVIEYEEEDEHRTI